MPGNGVSLVIFRFLLLHLNIKDASVGKHGWIAFYRYIYLIADYII